MNPPVSGSSGLAALPSLAAAAVGMQVGAALVASRFVLEQTSPLSLALLRYGVGCLCLLPPLLASRRVPFAGRDLVSLALLGVLQFGVVVALLNYALLLVPAARAALIFATVPLLTLLIAAVCGFERFTWPKAAGVLLSVVGVGLALGPGVLARGYLLGDLAAFGSALAAALCSVLYRPYLKRYPPLQVSSFAMFASVLLLALLASSEGFFVSWPRFTPSGWLAVVFIGLSRGVGYALLLWALGRTEATRVTVFLALSPVAAAVFGVVWLGEPAPFSLWAGLVCVLLGVRLALWRGRDTSRPQKHECGAGG